MLSAQLAENEDVQNMLGPDVFPNFPGRQALSYLAVASVIMAGVCATIAFTKPDSPVVSLGLFA